MFDINIREMSLKLSHHFHAQRMIFKIHSEMAPTINWCFFPTMRDTGDNKNARFICFFFNDIEFYFE